MEDQGRFPSSTPAPSPTTPLLIPVSQFRVAAWGQGTCEEEEEEEGTDTLPPN